MTPRKVVFALMAALVASIMLAPPALADHDDDDHGRHEGRHRGHGGEHWRGRGYYRPRAYYRPRGYYYPEPEVYYAPPPPVIYAPPPPPGVGFNLIFPFHIR